MSQASTTRAAADFARGYAERSGMTLDELAEWSVVVRCECGYEECDGWALVPKSFPAEVRAATGRWLGGTDYGKVYWPEEEA